MRSRWTLGLPGERSQDSQQLPEHPDVRIHKVYVDGGSSTEIMYEHCFEQLLAEEKKTIRPPTTPLVGFAEQVSWPLGLIILPITLYDCSGHISKTIMAGIAIIKGEKFQPNVYNHISQKRCQPERAKGTEDVEHAVINDAHSDQTITIAANLSKTLKEKLCELLRSNKDVFAWTPTDMTGIPRELAEHKLNIHPQTFPVWQKKHAITKERSKAITTEVSKLVEARILKAVFFPKWVSNPVMVKKIDGTWCMCIDFTSINKACPKDSYSLPKIDQSVESLEGFKLKYFLDTYKGYHQIRKARENKEKTSFHTEHGTFYYEKMSFGLKNARATYPQLMDNMFASQLGQNIE
ncbi:hypothetical protein Tco_1553305, partial [Tanacetum coccineum]